MLNKNIHNKDLVSAGKRLAEASKVLIMLHGRGASAEDILGLAEHLNVKDYALIAPQAKGNSWYPYSFMSPTSQNEPWLSSALSMLSEIVDDLKLQNFLPEQIYFAGFSQGACLTLEFVTRNATKYGGVVAFTGGLIGNRVSASNYNGDFQNTSIFIGSSNPDPHVPADRVTESEKILKEMHADVTAKLYKNMGHTISPDEINEANKLVFIS
ncbi:MAG: dienelactone hydrolase family protein [Bacteroidota bacterium]|nr:dienelactone hydrolase family protein [Bacteroidota bacterium]